jgi:hypothetical protein
MEPRIPEGLRLFYYLMGMDQAVARSLNRSETAGCVAQSTEAIERSRVLLGRLGSAADNGPAATPSEGPRPAPML